MINFEELNIWSEYDRPQLADLWGYKSYQAISRGVVTPSGTNLIILFVTKLKQDTEIQYNDYIDNGLLFWEGENQHGSDFRITNARINEDEIHLFYRDKHHMPFIYYGTIQLFQYKLHTEKPSEFIFSIGQMSSNENIANDIIEIQNNTISVNKTEIDATIKNRLGQGNFRNNLIKLWGKCSLTGASLIGVLRASHIKPWKNSSNTERIDPYNGLLLIPNADVLFDNGYISFDENGNILVSKAISEKNLEQLGIDRNMRLEHVFAKNIPYLDYHRKNIFLG